MELGQFLFSNSPIQKHEAYWASNGLTDIAEVIQEYRGDDGLLVSNYGEAPFDCDIFSMRTYCWCDGDREGHEDGCPPNFIHKPSGLIINWYKHAMRGITSNKKLSKIEWLRIVQECLEVLEDTKK